MQWKGRMCQREIRKLVWTKWWGLSTAPESSLDFSFRVKQVFGFRTASLRHYRLGKNKRKADHLFCRVPNIAH
jgi:hypothetical protein